MPPEPLYSELTDNLLGSFYEVYRELRGGFLESTYRNAMIVSLGERGISAEKEVSLEVRFHDVLVGRYRMDLVVNGLIVVECKTASAIDPAHESQLLSYLHGTSMPLGFVFNFGPKPSFKRMAYDPKHPTKPRITDDW